MSFWDRGLWLRAQGPGRGSRKFGSSEGRKVGRSATLESDARSPSFRGSRHEAQDPRPQGPKAPRPKAQGPRSKVQGPRSKVQGPRSKVQGPRSEP
ncbi:hypothetical protein Y026_5021 [Burkholderia pseudomallei TSV28]|nr:hypothetical protein Y026_5021 [Burkholderia pseudomallei TSV28]